jgi:hypothetical protein
VRGKVCSRHAGLFRFNRPRSFDSAGRACWRWFHGRSDGRDFPGALADGATLDRVGHSVRDSSHTHGLSGQWARWFLLGLLNPVSQLLFLEGGHPSQPESLGDLQQVSFCFR